MGCCNEGDNQDAVLPNTPIVSGVGVEITEHAAVKLLQLINSEGQDPTKTCLRIGVYGGGCSGMQYSMDFDDKHDDDMVFERGGARVVVDQRSIKMLNGSVLDYADGLIGSGFQIKNPNVKSSCGCGQSFGA
jgi:iron-sulfur cluster assembly accessory protein